MWLLFEQTATALVNAIDAKDKYTHGHSARVAEYCIKIYNSDIYHSVCLRYHICIMQAVFGKIKLTDIASV